jgi:hypothetical protein
VEDSVEDSLDNRVKTAPNQELLDKMWEEYQQAQENNPVARLAQYLAPKSLADAAGMFSRRATALIGAAAANPQSPTETGFDGYGVSEPMLEFNKQQEMRDRLVKDERRTAPRANNMGGFIGQMYGDDYNIGNAYGN